MKRLHLFAQILTMMLIFSVSVSAQNFKGCPTGKERIPSSNQEYEQELLRLVNEIRAKKGLNALEWNEDLAHAARYHAKDMQVDRYFEHAMYDRVGRWNRLKLVCGTFEKMDVFTQNKIFSRSENIGAGSITPQEMFNDWMNSPGHKENIMDPEAKYMGAGYIEVEGSEWGTYWVQCFGM
jgi:uncharacterized protein YkwD